ncbi:MAG: HK97 family phage prohead protease [Rickettsiales bacterium]|nr:HK97 family phage prohead protease [Rickettsiales bacterium]
MSHDQYITPCFSVKNLDRNGVFTGYASVFNVVDNHNDVILKGAFEGSIKNMSQSKTRIKMLWQHDTKEPVGVFNLIKEDEQGLYVEGKLLLDLVKGREVYALLKSGAIEGLSIGYNPTNFSYDEVTGVRYISDIDLREISLVTFPANEQAKIMSVKDSRYDQDNQLLRLAMSIEESMSVLL